MITTQTRVRILFAEDDPNLSMILQDYFEILNYDVHNVSNGEEGLKLFSENNYDLIILDVMMPKKDGFTLAKEIREKNNEVPIIFLTAKNLKEDRIKGFQYGCDDYITKPFSTEELSLRMKAILKRCSLRRHNQTLDKTDIFSVGKFKFDSKNLLLILGNHEHSLTRKESALLKLLCENKNSLLPREVALETIWGENDYFIGRSMDVFITKLRKYLRPDPNISITNVHGIGFKLEVAEK